MTSDDSYVDFSSLYIHSKNQYISMPGNQSFSIFIYKFEKDNLRY